MTQLSEIRNCLEGNTMSNPVHTSVTRMCGGRTRTLPTAWRAVHSEMFIRKSNLVQPSRLMK